MALFIVLKFNRGIVSNDIPINIEQFRMAGVLPIADITSQTHNCCCDVSVCVH